MHLKEPFWFRQKRKKFFFFHFGNVKTKYYISLSLSLCVCVCVCVFVCLYLVAVSRGISLYWWPSRVITDDNIRIFYLFLWKWITVLELKHAPHAGTIIRRLFLWVIFHDSAALSIYYMVTLMILSPLLMHKHIMQEQYKLQCFI